MNRRLGLLVVPMVVAGVLAGCGSSSSDSGSAESSQAGSAATSAPASAESAATSAAAESAAAGGDCGVSEIDGVQVRSFCGKGTATMSNGAVTMTLDTAECATDDTGFAVNAGTIVLDPDDTAVTATTQYIGFAILAEGDTAGGNFPDGAYDGLVTGNDRGTDLTSTAAVSTITLTDGGKAGTVTGETFEGQPITGSFTCS